MTATVPSSLVDVRPPLSAAEFHSAYVNKKPVLMKGALSGMPAADRWSVSYFGEIAPDLPVRLKTGRVADGVTTTVRMADYCATVAAWEKQAATLPANEVATPPAYLHDVPLLSLLPQLRRDLDPFPADLFTKFFRDQWWTFPQFFVGPSRAITPLHFDTLLTHNLFFQFSGSKRFLMVDAADRDRCYTYNWRWSKVDPDDPDLDRFPMFRDVRTSLCVVEAGDILYMPPGTLHKVTCLTPTVSFNIDWHDRSSALRSLNLFRNRMPVANLRYNALFALGVCAGVPLRVLMPALRSYFNYIS
jgi:hypothetical protein